jgi:hypothetical protein
LLVFRKQGELLVELAVPELDDQISQNEATLAQLKAAVQKAEANTTLAEATWGRDMANRQFLPETAHKEINMFLHLPIAILATLSPIAVSDTVPKFDTIRETY